MGCKDRLFFLFIVLCSSFTLTMWDVKSFQHLEVQSSIQFYLNYVGCKVVISIFQPVRNSRFYLNYVGCKVQIMHFYIEFFYRFTLTMWDVKQVIDIKVELSSKVLP